MGGGVLTNIIVSTVREKPSRLCLWRDTFMSNHIISQSFQTSWQNIKSYHHSSNMNIKYFQVITSDQIRPDRIILKSYQGQIKLDRLEHRELVISDRASVQNSRSPLTRSHSNQLSVWPNPPYFPQSLLLRYDTYFHSFPSAATIFTGFPSFLTTLPASADGEPNEHLLREESTIFTPRHCFDLSILTATVEIKNGCCSVIIFMLVKESALERTEGRERERRSLGYWWM